MGPLVWFLPPFLCVLFSGGVVYYVMRSRMDVLLSRQRAELAAAQAALETEKKSLELNLQNAADAARTKAFDQFLNEIRIEERHYTREQKVLFMTRKCLVRQERIFFRNIPLSNWIEQECPIEEGADVEKLAHTMSVFASAILPELAPLQRPSPIKLLRRL